MHCTTSTIEITETSKMYLIKSEVRRLLREQGYGELSTKSLKKKAIASDWVANKADFRFKSTWLMVLDALMMAGKVVRLVPRSTEQKIAHLQQESVKRRESVEQVVKQLQRTSVEQVVQELLREYDGYAPIFAYRDRLSHLSRQQQDRELYRLEREGKIDLSTLQETRFYLDKLDQAIPQEIGGPIFFIQAA